MSNHGVKPLEYKIVVKPDPIKEELGDSGLFVKAEMTKDADMRMQTRGTLIDYSDMAFDGWKCELPKRMSRVEYAMYAGQKIIGADGEEYRVMNDKDLVAILGEGL